MPVTLSTVFTQPGVILLLQFLYIMAALLFFYSAWIFSQKHTITADKKDIKWITIAFLLTGVDYILSAPPIRNQAYIEVIVRIINLLIPIFITLFIFKHDKDR